MKTKNNNIMITGGSSGIGLALVKKFYDEDNHIVVLGRDIKRLNKLKDTYPLIDIVQIDITDYQKYDELIEKYNNVNILINNAGIQENYEFSNPSIDFKKIEYELEVNLVAPILLTKKFIPILKQQNESAIINVSSGLAIVPKESAPVYCASKAGIHIFSKSLRWQLQDSNIKLFEIIPPLVDTNMTKGRGKGKITPETLIKEFWVNFVQNRYEMNIGKVKILYLLNRAFPGFAEHIMRKGL